MCGRFVRYSPINDFLSRVGIAETRARLNPSYNIAPSDALFTVRNNDRGKREWLTLSWGFLPHWAKDVKLRRPINARAEEVHNKPYFRDAFRHRRCLVVFDGWYEWRQLTGFKQPYYVTLKGQRPFAFAGLWDLWPRGDGPPIETCCILTTVANRSLEYIHSRMPLVLRTEDYDRWLDPAVIKREALEDILAFPNVDIEAWPVSKRVNKPENNDPQCLGLAQVPG